MRTARNGGQAGWGRRDDLDEHGWVAGWYERSGEILREVRIGPDGRVWRARPAGGQFALQRRLEPQEAAALGVAVEMLTRACDKRDEWNVVDVQRALRRYVEWQERVEADAMVSLDGCRKTVREGDRSWQVAGFAMAKHDGSVDRVGPLDDVCNYRAEMRAQLHAASGRGARRIIIVFDASSPVAVLQRFGRMGASGRRSVLVREIVDDWWRELAAFEVVVFLWQTSHAGEPVNEWADKEADAAAGGGGAVDCYALQRL